MRAYLKQEIKNPGWGERERERLVSYTHTGRAIDGLFRLRGSSCDL